MAKIDDLVTQVHDAKLRRELETAVAELKRRTRFGLVYENHLPEMAALPGIPPEVGSLVVRRNKLSARHALRVTALQDGTATLEPVGGGAVDSAPVSELFTLQRFGEPIYPGLEKVGSVERGGADRPHHAVINAENYHAVQLLLHLYEGQVDCLYLDPPYNTGARDWTYNNDYVDSSDAFRHSKWLSFMEKRLQLAKRLLKEGDGVLVITIDEHEVHTLGVLLAQIFPAAVRQMVTIVINQKGVAQGRLSRVEEFAFFCFNPALKLEPQFDDLLAPNIAPTEEIQQPRWERLLRGGVGSKRKDSPTLFFPIYVDPERREIIKIGDPLPLEQEPDLSDLGSRTVAYPLRTDGSLGRWRVSPPTLRNLLAKGYVRLGGFDETRGTWTILYLGQKAQNEIETGVLQIVGRDEITHEVKVVYSEVQQRSVKTVWHRATHDSGNYGSNLLRNILGEGGVFSFPKSVYAVRDSIGTVVGNRPNALIVDFFAGSGTTFHATCLLNAEDGGQRRCILVTNNEVSEEQARPLRQRGLYKGDAEFEKSGIFERVTRPRCEAVVTGQRADGTPVPGNHIGGRPLSDGFEENVSFFRLNYLNPDRVDMGHQFAAIAPLLWLEAGGFGAEWETEAADRSEPGYSLPPGTHYGILFKESRFSPFRNALTERPDITHVFLVTDSEEAYAEMRAALPPTIRARMLYRDYLRSFRIGGTGESGTTL